MAPPAVQQPATSTTIRPQQPTYSVVAALPVELLQRILDLALEGEGAWTRQSTRLRFGRVCSLWWQLADVGTEVAVVDTMMADVLAKQLKAKGSKARRDRVRSLEIDLQDEPTAGAGKRLASLVVACLSLEKLVLRAAEPMSFGTDTTLGKPLLAALMRLTKLKHFFYEIPNDLVLPEMADYGALICSWPRLATLIIPRCFAWTLREFNPEKWVSLPNPVRLQRLHLNLGEGSGGNLDTINKIITSSFSTLRHLDLGPYHESAFDLTPQFNLSDLSVIARVAPQLHTFKSSTVVNDGGHPPACDYLATTLSALRDVRILSLGVGGYDLSNIFSLLQPLPFLHTLSFLVESEGIARMVEDLGRYRTLSAEKAVAFIEHAPALKHLTLPERVYDVWEEEELDNVRVAARKQGVVVICDSQTL